MTLASTCAGPIALTLLFGFGQAAWNTRTPGVDAAAAAPLDTGTQTPRSDPAAARTPDTSAATPPISPPSPAAPDTPPAAAQPGKQPDQAKTGGLKVSRVEYEGWRQYSVNCARCHGQDVLPNPVAANLLVSLGAGGPIGSPAKFIEVVTKGRPEKGMPALGTMLTPEQVNAIYGYVKGRADGRISAGRPDRPDA